MVAAVLLLGATTNVDFGIASTPTIDDGDRTCGMGGEGDDVLLRFGECVATAEDANCCCLLVVRSRCRVVRMDVVVVGVTSVGGLSREC